MEIESHNEELIVRYLLGDLSDDDQERLEDRAFSDDRYMQEVLAVEGDLIDEYLRGSLSDRERRQFESRFLASHERRQKVEFARALAHVASKSAVAEAVPQPAPARAPASWLDSFRDFLRDANPMVKLSLAAAALILTIGVPWLIAQTVKLRSEIGQLQAEQQTLEQQVAGERARNEELAGQLQLEKEQRERSEALARRLEKERTPTAQSPKDQIDSGSSPIIASLMLLPGVSRSGGNRPELVIAQAAQAARLRIGLEREDEYQSYRVELRTVQGQEIWTQDNLRPRQSRAGRVLILLIPGSLLETGKYELTLKGAVDRQQTEDVRFYYFDILRN